MTSIRVDQVFSCPAEVPRALGKGNKAVEKKYGRAIVTAARPPHMIIDNFITFHRRSAMASAHALPGVLTKVFDFFLVASAFVFISMLVTGLHP